MAITEAATMEQLEYVNYMMHGFVPPTTCLNKVIPVDNSNHLHHQVNAMSSVPEKHFTHQLSCRIGMSSMWMNENSETRDVGSVQLQIRDPSTNWDNLNRMMSSKSNVGEEDSKTSSDASMTTEDTSSYLSALSATYASTNENHDHNSYLFDEESQKPTYGDVSAWPERINATSKDAWITYHTSSLNWMTIVIIPQTPIPENVKEINAGLCWDLD